MCRGARDQSLQCIMGSCRGGTEEEESEVRVWRLDTLEPEHTLTQPTGCDVYSLFGVSGEVWGAVGKQLVMWGRDR